MLQALFPTTVMKTRRLSPSRRWTSALVWPLRRLARAVVEAEPAMAIARPIALTIVLTTARLMTTMARRMAGGGLLPCRRARRLLRRLGLAAAGAGGDGVDGCGAARRPEAAAAALAEAAVPSALPRSRRTVDGGVGSLAGDGALRGEVCSRTSGGSSSSSSPLSSSAAARAEVCGDGLWWPVAYRMVRFKSAIMPRGVASVGRGVAAAAAAALSSGAAFPHNRGTP